MPVERVLVSWSQFCGLLEIDPARLVGVEVNRITRVIQLVMEPEHEYERHVSATDPGQGRQEVP